MAESACTTSMINVGSVTRCEDAGLGVPTDRHFIAQSSRLLNESVSALLHLRKSVQICGLQQNPNPGSTRKNVQRIRRQT
jgi:hypothetical protein